MHHDMRKMAEAPESQVRNRLENAGSDCQPVEDWDCNLVDSKNKVWRLEAGMRQKKQMQWVQWIPKHTKVRPVSWAERGWSVKRVLIYCSEAIQKAPWELRSSRMRTTENEEKENLDLTSFR